MMMNKVIRTVGKAFGIGLSKNKRVALAGEHFGGMFGNFRKYFDIKVPTVENAGKMASNLLRSVNIAGHTGATAIGGTAGAFVGGPMGAGIGAGVSNVAFSLGKRAIKGSFNYPKTAFGVSLFGVGAYSLAKPIIAPRIMRNKLNRPTNPAVPSRAVGPGFVTMGNSPRIRVPHNNLGATGDLTLSQYKLRHGRGRR